ncbi:hypothetical protein BJ944DRAFT_250509 [Cunninghamella echinulata]|nr:hypothetical protein BJ944DRAFT_250509 [Cunninghamella echinulata]
MTDTSSLDMSNASLVSSQQLDDNQHTEGSTFSSIPSLPSLDADVTRILSDDFEQQELEELLSQKHSPLRGEPISLSNSIQHNNIPINNSNDTNNSSNNNYNSDYHENTSTNNNNTNNNNSNNKQQPTYKPSFQHIVTGHIRSFSIVLSRFMFKDNNLTLLLNIIGHLLAARQLWGKPKASVARYTNILTRTSPTINNTNISSSSSLSSSAITTLMMDQFRGMGVLHLALGCLAALALKERRLSTERTALWVLAISSWGQSYVQAKAYLTSPSLYTLNALRELGTLNGLLTIITSIALRNTIRRTGRIL